MRKSSKIRVGIFGGSGYGGSELLRILLFHPESEVVFVTANEQAGKSVSDVHKNLLGLTELIFSTQAEAFSYFAEVDIIFFALPHGQAISLLPQLPKDLKAIDLSGDFRLENKDEFEKYYKLSHPAMELQKEFVYGLTELNRESIRNASYIANPGCFATATVLALAPLSRSGLVGGKIIVDAKTGSSGSGIKPASNTHHPQRVNSFYAYKPFSHQHLPEIKQCLRKACDSENELVFMTHSLPVSRGIFISAYFEAKEDTTAERIGEIYRNFYKGSFFIRFCEGSPDINWVKNSNFCDLSIHSSGKDIAVFTAIDNLVKGAAGQAVQNMNLMFGLDEKTGLLFPGGNP